MNCLDLKLCNVKVICPFVPYQFVHGLKSFLVPWGLDFAEHMHVSLNRLIDLQHSGSNGIVKTCSCTASWAYDRFKVKCWKIKHITGIGGPIGTKRKRCKSIGSGAHSVALHFYLSHGIDLEFSRPNFEIAVFQECEDRLICNKSDVSR